MSQPLPDPTRWLADLMKSQHTVMWQSDVADTSKALAAAAAPWTEAVAELHQMADRRDEQFTAPWAAALPGSDAATEPVTDRRFAGEAWTKDPRFEAVARVPRPDRPAEQGAGGGARRRAQQGAVGVRAAPGHRCAEPGQQSGDQPGGPAAAHGDRRRQPG